MMKFRVINLAVALVLLVVLSVVAFGCGEGARTEMAGCRDMCQPNAVLSFTPSGSHGHVPSTCVCNVSPATCPTPARPDGGVAQKKPRAIDPLLEAAAAAASVR